MAGAFDDLAGGGAFDDLSEPPATPTSSRLADLGREAAKGIVDMGETAVGWGNQVTGGRFGNALEQLGYQPSMAKKAVDEYMSDGWKADQQAVQETKGFLPTIGEVATRPWYVGGAIARSAPSMVGGLGVGQAVQKVAPALSGAVAGAVGEGAVSMGSSAEQTRQETGTLDARGQAGALAAGAGVAALGSIGNVAARVAKAADIDTARLANVGGQMDANIATRTAKGFGIEAAEEAGQSSIEQMAGNFAAGKPLTEGVPEAAGVGAVVGGVMGGGFSAAVGNRGGADERQQNDPAATAPPGPLQAAAVIAKATGAAPGDQPAGGPPAASQTPSEMGGMGGTRGLIVEAAKKAGTDPRTALLIASIETGGRFNADAKNPKSSASGMFQFMDATRKMFPEVTPEMWADPKVQAEYGSRFIANTNAAMQKHLGRELAPHESYMGHLLGSRGAVAMLTAAPNMSARDVVAQYDPKRADQIIRLNGMKDLTAGEAVAKWQSVAQRHLDRLGVEQKALPLGKEAAEMRVRAMAREGQMLEVVEHPTVPGKFAALPPMGGDPNEAQKPSKVPLIADIPRTDYEPEATEAIQAEAQGAQPAAPAIDAGLPAAQPGAEAAAPLPGVSAAQPEAVDDPAVQAALQQELAAAQPPISRNPVDGRPISAAQIDEGNYPKKHERWNGLDLTIENGVGDTRVAKDGSWSVDMQADYGYIRRTVAADKTAKGKPDRIDFYKPPDAEPDAPVYVFDQIDPETGDFDEHKVVFGVTSREQAELLYDTHFDDGSGPQRRAAAAEMSIGEFKRWLKSGTTSTMPATVAQPQVQRQLAIDDGIIPPDVTEAAESAVSVFSGVPEAAKWAADIEAAVTRPQELNDDDNAALADLNAALSHAGVAQQLSPLRSPPQADAALVAAVAEKAFGKRVIFAEATEGFSGVAFKDRVYLSASEQYPAAFTVAHEVMHTFEGQKVQAVVRDVFRTMGLNPEQQIAERQAAEQVGDKRVITRKYAENEIVADLNGAMWVDPKFWKELAARDESVFRKVAFKFMELGTKALNVVRGSKADASTIVRDVEAARTAIAQAWSEHLGSKRSARKVANGAPQFQQSKINPFAALLPSKPKKPDDTRYSQMKAPDTPEFRAFRGKSANNPLVSHEDGSPRVMFHGTARDITKFKGKQANAIFVTPKPGFAEAFADGSEYWKQSHYLKELSGEQIALAKAQAIEDAAEAYEANGDREELVGIIYAITMDREDNALALDFLRRRLSDQMPERGNIMPLYVRAENTFDYENPDHRRAVVRELDRSGRGLRVGVREEAKLKNGDWVLIENAEVQQAIKKAGFDSFTVYEGGVKNLAVYDSKQLKSATGNRGTFDKDNEDIRFSKTAPNTPAFKKWFGDSKVVDEQGRPLVVYHGTVEDVTNFDKERIGQNYPNVSKAFYFSQSPSGAADYALDHAGASYARPGMPGVFAGSPADTGRGGSNIVPVYLRVTNPLKKKALGNFSPEQWLDKHREKLLEQARAGGHDGIVIEPGKYFGDRGAVYAVFEPEQIKSATGNAGTFDPANPDIRFSKLPPLQVPDRVSKYLTDGERSKLRRDVAVRLVELFDQLPSDKEMAAIAFAGRAARGWYKDGAAAISHVFGPDADRFAALLAAMSPQNSVQANLRNTAATWANWVQAGRPQGRGEIIKVMGRSVIGSKQTKSVLPAWINNSVRALTTDDPANLVISGPKVNSFMKNLRGNVQEVTNDSWMAAFAAVDQGIFGGELNVKGTDPGKGAGYLAMSARVREAAQTLSSLTGDAWTPAEVQETVWAWAKTLYELQSEAAGGYGAREIIDDGALTDDLIAATPEFSALLLDDTYGKQLRKAGYGQRIDDLRTLPSAGGRNKPRADGEARPFAERTQQRFERAVADRLEQRRDRVATERVAGRAETRRLRLEGGVRGSDGGLAFSRGPDQGNGRAQQLQGLPATVQVDGRAVTFGPFQPAHDAAAAYMRRAGLKYDPPRKYAKVDRARAERIAAAFDSMKHEPQSPAVKRAYEQMIRETLAQYEEIMATGLKVEFIDFAKTGDPYGNPRNAILDVVNNNHMWVFSTKDGFGSSDLDVSDNPLLAETQFEISGRPALANDIFRVVHDYFGHIKDGVGFRADGEENAWRSHSAMYSPLARMAMTSETRGQNSWLNFGPYGEKNRTATTEDTHFADQKIGVLPQWAIDEGRTDDEPKFSRTDTPEFKRWFGDSKVVDKDGRPKPMYHGTYADIKRFRRRVGDIGMHFGDAPTANDRIADGVPHRRNKDGTESGANVVPVYLNIVNPLRLEDHGYWNANNMKGTLLKLFPQDAARIGPAWGTRGLSSTKDIREFLQDKGYDGIVYKNTGEVGGSKPFRERRDAAREAMLKVFPKGKNSLSPADQKTPEYIAYREAEDAYTAHREANGTDSYIAFEPTQIKSATGNNGQFDPQNADIRFSKQDRVLADPRPDWKHETIFYSALHTEMDKFVSAKALPAIGWKQALTALKNKGLVKQDEIEWTGIEEWIDAKGAAPAGQGELFEVPKIPKADVMRFIADNGVQIREVTLSGPDEAEKASWISEMTDSLYEEWESDFDREVERHMNGVDYASHFAREIDDADEIRDLIDDGQVEGLRPGDEAPDALWGVYSEYSRAAEWVYEEESSAEDKAQELNDERYSEAEDEYRSENSRDRESFEEQAEAMWDEERGDYDDKFRNYSLPGGDNYREVLMLLASPGEDGQFKGGHWDEKGVLAHTRLKDRFEDKVGSGWSGGGDKVLFVEEIQSDWAQEGRENGFMQKADPAEVAAAEDRFLEAIAVRDRALAAWRAEQAAQQARVQRLDALERELRVTESIVEEAALRAEAGRSERLVEAGLSRLVDLEHAYYTASVRVDAEQEGAREASTGGSGIPRAPFVDKTDKWVELTLKRIIRIAAEGGYDKVAFATGQQNADRYDLQQEVEKVVYTKNGDERWHVAVYGNGYGSRLIVNETMDPKKLRDTLGNDLSQKIMEDKGRPYDISQGRVIGDGASSDSRMLDGLDLRMGGEGMVKFYDQIVPNLLKKLLPKLGGDKQLQTITLKYPQGNRDSSRGRNVPHEHIAFPITDKMRTSVLGGMPLFLKNPAALQGITVGSVKEKIKGRWTDLRSLSLQALGGRQIAEIYAPDLPQLPEYQKLVQRMQAGVSDAVARADDIAVRWGKIKDIRPLSDLMHDATLARVDPAEAYQKGDSQSHYDELRARWNKLSPQAQSMYREVRDAYAAHGKAVRQAMRERIERAEMSAPKKAQMLKRMDDTFKELKGGPYFPLARFGQYLVVVRDDEGKTANVSRAESKAEADALRRELKEQYKAGYTVSAVVKQADFNARSMMVGNEFLERLFKVLDDTGIGEDLQDDINQLVLSSLPEMSWGKHGIHRKGTPGFTEDARRAFAHHMVHGARHLQRLRFSDQMDRKLSEMQKYVKGRAELTESVKAQQVLDEVNKRHEIVMNPKTGRGAQALTSFGFFFHLGLSPASALVNLTQVPLVAGPMLAARYGANAITELGKAMAQTTAAKNNLTKSSALSADEQRAIQQGIDEGVIDVTLAHDAMGIAEGNDSKLGWKLKPVMRWASFMFHHAERFNRQATFLTAYRLARAKGDGHAQAVDAAADLTYKSQFDYSSSNRPRAMQGDVARVMTQFKQYVQNMLFLQADAVRLAVKGDKEAMKMLAGMTAMHALAAGALGMHPLVSPLLSLASMLGSDDDEPWDAKVALQNYLSDALGQKTAEVLVHGASRFGPADISGRVSLDLGRMLFPDVHEGLEGADAYAAFATGLLGPVFGGVGVGLARGAQLLSEGHWLRAMESMVPSVVRGPIKSARYAMEGVRDKSGVAIDDEVGLAGQVSQALGFRPSEVANAMEGRGAILSLDKRLDGRRADLMDTFAKAAMKGGDTSGAIEAIQKWNETNPTRVIGAMHLQLSIRARARRIASAEQGVPLKASERDVLQAGRFALSQP